MGNLRILFTILLSTVLLGLTSVDAQEARARHEILKLIRQEKFDLVLPGAMRDNDVDMWIHVMQSGRRDPLELDLGGQPVWQTTADTWATLGFFVFTDRGESRIERAILGGRGDRELYDIFGSESDLTEFVSERDPKRIAVNMSDRIPSSNGLSHTGYLRLVKLLGDRYADRLVSADRLITDFRVRRVQTEVSAFTRACEIQLQIMDEALRSIEPGKTTREDLGWWVEDQLLKRGLERALYAGWLPGVRSTDPGGSGGGGGEGYVIQRGDYISWDWGIRYLNFGTDYKRKAYILREGETELPQWMQRVWDRAMEAREILRPTVKVGRTARENLEVMVQSLEDGGFLYFDMTNVGSKDRELVDAFGDDERSVVSIDCHSVGNFGFSQIAEGPSIARFRWRRADLTVQQNNIFAFEIVVRTWVPELGKRWSVSLEDNAIVTEKGIEALYPRNDSIIVVP